MRLLLAAALLTQWVWPQSPQAQFQSIARQWQSVEAQRVSAGLRRPSLPCDPIPPGRLEAMIRSAAARHGLQPALVTAMVRQESGGSPCAVSLKGAIGLMQLMPATAASLGIGDPLDPQANLDGGVRFLKGLLDRYQGDYALALSAYNAGPRRVDDAGRVPAIAETQAYVRNVIRHAALPPISLDMPELP